MTCTKRYACDLCRDEMREATDGIGLRWASGNNIRHVFWADSEHHLCNRCIEGLRAMFVEIDKTREMYRELDRPELLSTQEPPA